ncbi:SAP domain-containing protein [Microbacteriaceae bacterium VKM Ac-2854]|nr:SAP domain-containing protein [Microbacteriaceae bacterium VKM Ac-2854]
MFIESGYDLHLLVHAFFLEPSLEESGWGPRARSLPLAPGGIGPLVLVVLDDRMDCRRVVEVLPEFRDDVGPAHTRILTLVRENAGRYIALAHLGDGRTAEEFPDAQPWALSLARLKLDLADEGVLMLRHVMYGDGIFIDGWHDFRGSMDPVPEVTLTREPRLDADFAERLHRQRSTARATLSGESIGRTRMFAPYTPPPPASNEGVALTMELDEERFRELTWKVFPLSEFCRANGLKAYGTKAALIERVAALLAGRDTSEWLDKRRRPRFVDVESQSAD